MVTAGRSPNRPDNFFTLRNQERRPPAGVFFSGSDLPAPSSLPPGRDVCLFQWQGINCCNMMNEWQLIPRGGLNDGL